MWRQSACTPFVPFLFQLNAAKAATARDWCQSSTNSMNGERLLSCRRSVAPGGMPGGGAFGRGDIQWRTHEWGDPARDALTCLPLPSNSDSRTAPDAFKTPPTLDFGSLYGVRLGTPPWGLPKPLRSRSDFASEIDVGDFRWNFRLLFCNFGDFAKLLYRWLSTVNH